MSNPSNKNEWFFLEDLLMYFGFLSRWRRVLANICSKCFIVCTWIFTCFTFLSFHLFSCQKHVQCFIFTYSTLSLADTHGMMMFSFITFNRSLVPLIESLFSSNPWESESSGFRRNRTDDLGINSPLLWPSNPRLQVKPLLIMISPYGKRLAKYAHT